MADARSHYDRKLGPIYAWMVGPFEDASAASDRVFAELDLGSKSADAIPTDRRADAPRVAIDLGCGHGVQSIALARRGYRVIAVDFCEQLLRELAARAAELPIVAVRADLRDTARYLPDRIDAAVCMGDTLTHLPSQEGVDQLLRDVTEVLAPGGVVVLGFRDYVTAPLRDDARFIPVRSDPDRILTCFLEYGERTVRVHDLVHSRRESGFELSVGSYEKLRLDPRSVAAQLVAAGLTIELDRTERGFVMLAARRPIAR